MIVKLRVVYEGQEMQYDMPVGDARMTVKWLGMAAAQRFSATIKPGGYRRRREKAGPAKIISTSAKLLPCRIYTRESTFLHPEKSIKEEIKQGSEVSVVLTNKTAVNHIGRTQRDRWAFIAFNTSEKNAAQRDRAIADEYKLMEQVRERQNREELAKQRALAARKGAQMRRVMVSQLYSPGKVEEAFDRDWARICHPILQPIDKISDDIEEQSKIKDAMLANYVTLVEVFKHYASVGSSVATAELDLLEFSAFIHDLRGFSAAKSRDVVEKTFGEAVSACKGDKARTTAGTMGICEFIYSAMRLACLRHYSPTASHGTGGESSVGSSKIKTANSVHQAVSIFMETVMVPLAQRKVIGLQIKTALDTDDILAIYCDNDAKLKAVFDKYCKAGDRSGGPAALGVLLNIAEFGMVLREAGLLGGNNKEDDELTVKEARQAFAGAQNDLCGGDDTISPRSKENFRASSEQMTYPEFLEGIARVAILKWEDASMTAFDKIGRAVQAVTSLLKDSMSSTTNTQCSHP